MTKYEICTLIINVFIASSAIATALYAIFQFKRSAKIHKDILDWNKRIETRKRLDSQGSFNSRVLLNEIFHFTDRRQPIDLEEILNVIKEKPKVRMHINQMLNYHETLALGVFNDIYVESIIKADRKGWMIKHFQLFIKYIEYERQERNPKVFVQYEGLVRKWIEEDRNEGTLHKLGKV